YGTRAGSNTDRQAGGYGRGVSNPKPAQSGGLGAPRTPTASPVQTGGYGTRGRSAGQAETPSRTPRASSPRPQVRQAAPRHTESTARSAPAPRASAPAPRASAPAPRASTPAPAPRTDTSPKKYGR